MSIESWRYDVPDVVCRRLVNHPWEPVTPYVREEVHLAGGPAPASGWWSPAKGDESGHAYLPQEPHLWILRQPETPELREPPERDHRADYFRRGWLRRQ